MKTSSSAALTLSCSDDSRATKSKQVVRFDFKYWHCVETVTYHKGQVHWIFVEIVLDVILRGKSGDKNVMEALASVFRRSVLSRAFQAENIGLVVRVQTLGFECPELAVQLEPLLGGDGFLVLERDNVNHGHDDRPYLQILLVK